MVLEGKGIFIWRIVDTEGGNIQAIVDLAAEGDFSHVLVKIADGIYDYNIDPNTGQDLVLPLSSALRARNIAVWGWHYIYGDNPYGEADKAVERVTELKIDGYVIDAESEFKQPGKEQPARQFMDRLRSGLPGEPVALSTYRYPSLHPQFPYETFLKKCDIAMPQVYWVNSHNPGSQLIRSLTEYQNLDVVRPYIPTGSAYKQGDWTPTQEDITEFFETARSLNLTGVNFYQWANCRKHIPDIWNTVQDYNWPVTPAEDITQRYIRALNTHDVSQVVNLYSANPVHVTTSRTIQGVPALRAWYTSFFKQILPNATYTQTGYSGTGNSRHMTWTAKSSVGRVNNGNDTFGLLKDQIAYHYTYFTVS